MNIKCMKLSWQGVTSCNSVCMLGQLYRLNYWAPAQEQCQVTLLVCVVRGRPQLPPRGKCASFESHDTDRVFKQTSQEEIHFKTVSPLLYFKQQNNKRLVTHRLVNPLASYASHKPQWWRSGWWSQPAPRGEATEGPGGCGPSAQTSPRGCRSCWWRCSCTRPGPNRYPSPRCGARCSCLCCWRRSGRSSCLFPNKEKKETHRVSAEVTPDGCFVAHIWVKVKNNTKLKIALKCSPTSQTLYPFLENYAIAICKCTVGGNFQHILHWKDLLI